MNWKKTDLFDLGTFRLIRRSSEKSTWPTPSIPWLVLQGNHKILCITGHVKLLHCNLKRGRTIKLKCSAWTVTVKKLACKFGCPRQENLQSSFENEHWTEAGSRSDNNNKQS